MRAHRLPARLKATKEADVESERSEDTEKGDEPEANQVVSGRGVDVDVSSALERRLARKTMQQCFEETK